MRTVVLALVLAGVPTMFAVFPELAGDTGLTGRRVLFGLWIVVAVLVGLNESRHVDRVRAFFDRQSSVREDRRLAALDRCLAALFDDVAGGLPPDYEFTVYLDETENKRLVPLYPAWQRDKVDLRIFGYGCGATGTAWARETLILVVGSAVSDGAYQLTPEQQEFFSGHAAVVATPIYDDEGVKRGVLTAMTRDGDAAFYEDSANQINYKDLAETVGVLVRVLSLP